MPVPILLRSYEFLQNLVQNSPKNTIKLNIPETLICGHDPTIFYLYTNSGGFLEVEQINSRPENDDSSCSMKSGSTCNNSEKA